MKKILVLTDFTANASHAAAAALRIAAKLDAGICLYHTLPYIPLIPGDSGGPYVAETEKMLFEDSKERLIQEADKLREVSVMVMGHCLYIEERSGEGSLGGVIGNLTEEPDIEMVIMGGRSGGALEHLITGSNTAAVIRKARKPVLVIPMNAIVNVPGKVVFATDFGTSDIPAVSFLHNLAVRLGFYLDIVHIIPRNEVVTGIGAEVAFRNYLVRHELSYNQVQETDVHKGLQHYCEENSASLLAMSHGEHSFIARMFGHSESRAMIADQRLAVLVFPPGFK
ncbi:universal stress protein [Mucilaginibacter sp. OK283]|uniref:universal stress protein n=1 Tax=Mucilaginibacter sp. OK283 TaxID=1881049 RepID=UPI0008CE2824|nr:universal stress protein [Mucilaginibacter sp. OK283]SEO42942.1 Nucleotide-binding universal stress protein, UspA family [Mucilaginibacter sp. OK283]